MTAGTLPGEQITADHRKRGLVFLGADSAGVGVAMALQMGLNANFMAEEIGVSGFQLGVLEAVRESCGILALGVLAVLSGLAEPLVAAIVLVVFAAGLGAYSVAPTYGWVVAASLIWSQGLHVWMPLPQSMALSLAEPGRSGQRLGQVRSAGAAGFAAGLAGAYVARRFGVEMRPMYLAAGAAAVVAAVACLGIPRRIKTPGPKLVFRRKYGVFYLLSFLEGRGSSGPRRAHSKLYAVTLSQ